MQTRDRTIIDRMKVWIAIVNSGQMGLVLCTAISKQMHFNGILCSRSVIWNFGARHS